MARTSIEARGAAGAPFDPQTSGGQLIALPAESAEPLVAALAAGGHRAAAIGEVLSGPPRIEVV